VIPLSTVRECVRWSQDDLYEQPGKPEDVIAPPVASLAEKRQHCAGRYVALYPRGNSRPTGVRAERLVTSITTCRLLEELL
jgi:hypothetical protein